MQQPLPGDDAWRERARLEERAKKLGLETLVLLFCTAWGPFLVYRALSIRRQLRRIGVPAPFETTVALVFGSGASAIFIGGLLLAGVAMSIAAFHSPDLFVANGWDEPMEVRIDGVARGAISSERPAVFELEPGRHELCAYRAAEKIACATKELERGDRLLWNPGSRGRFIAVTTTYSIPGAPVVDDQLEFLGRDEWHDVDRYFHPFEDPPEQITISGRSETRRWIMQARSEPCLLFLDNPTEGPLELLIDDRLALTLEPVMWRSARALEGEHHIVVRGAGGVLFDRRLTLRDYGAYVIDPGGATRYVVRTEGAGGAVADQPVAPAEIHDLTALEKIFDELTPMASYRPEQRGRYVVLTWAEQAQ